VPAHLACEFQARETGSAKASDGTRGEQSAEIGIGRDNNSIVARSSVEDLDVLSSLQSEGADVNG
jgi:hypothetical protein